MAYLSLWGRLVRSFSGTFSVLICFTFYSLVLGNFFCFSFFYFLFFGIFFCRDVWFFWELFLVCYFQISGTFSRLLLSVFRNFFLSLFLLHCILLVTYFCFFRNFFCFLVFEKFSYYVSFFIFLVYQELFCLSLR